MEDRFKFRCFNPSDETMHYTDFIVTATGFISRLECVGSSNRIFYIDNENLDSDKKLILMQCTGLEDKTGKLIYEKDIVKTFIGNFIIRYCYICKSYQLFSVEEDYCFSCEGDLHWFEFLEDLDKAEVIGNIYQNPELLN